MSTAGIDELMADLASALTAGRTPSDRYREFREVFLANDIGKRVLYDIMAWGHMYQSPAVRGDTHETYRRLGEANIVLKIMTTIHREPRERPTRQRSTETSNV